MSVALCIACHKNRAWWRGFCGDCRERMGPDSVRAIDRDAHQSGGAYKVRSKVAARLQMALASCKVYDGGRK